MTTHTIDAGVEDKINRVVGGINNLPTPPIVFSQIQKVLNNPNTSAFDIAAILQEDPAMSAKVLKLTNSAYYGLAREIESVKQAVVIVGLESVKNLVLSASVFDAFSKKQLDKDFQDVFWRHSLGTAFAGRIMALKLSAKTGFDAEAAFSGGMLHDIGKMVISVYMPDDAAKIKELKAEKPNLSEGAIEEEILGYNHSQIGALLGKQWKLPSKLIEAIQCHHHPMAIDLTENSLPHLIHMANYLTKLTFDDDPDEDSYVESIDEEALAAVGVSEDEILEFADPLRVEYGKSETFMEMAKGL